MAPSTNKMKMHYCVQLLDFGVEETLALKAQISVEK